MIKFDLEKALAGEKVITSDGREVEQLHTFDRESIQTLYGVMEGSVERWNCLGEYHVGTTKHPANLFMAPNKLSGFLNHYSNGLPQWFSLRELADSCAIDRVACIDLSQFEEGHGL